LNERGDQSIKRGMIKPGSTSRKGQNVKNSVAGHLQGSEGGEKSGMEATGARARSRVLGVQLKNFERPEKKGFAVTGKGSLNRDKTRKKRNRWIDKKKDAVK